MLRALLTYHPHVGTFRRGRGAWRVRVCALLGGPTAPTVVNVYPGGPQMPVRALRIPVARRLQPGTWANPTELLLEYHARLSHNGG